MTARLSADVWKWLTERKILWLTNEPRWLAGRPALGVPQTETDDKDEPTGYVLFNGLDYLDEWLIEKLCPAGKKYAEAHGGDPVVAYQSQVDLDNLRKLLVEKDYLNPDIDLNARFIAEAKRQAKTLNVPEPEAPREDVDLVDFDVSYPGGVRPLARDLVSDAQPDLA